MQVFQDLVRVSNIDAFAIYGEVEAIEQLELNIWGKFLSVQFEGRHF